MLKKRGNFKNIILITLSSILTALFIFSDDGYLYDSNILILCFIISVFCLFKLFVFTKYPFSLNQIIYLFFLFFFSIAPAVQYKYDITFWTSYKNLSKSDYIFGNILILVILAVYTIVYNYKTKKLIKTSVKINVYPHSTKLKVNNFYIVSVSFIALLIFAYSKNFNLYAILFRGGFSKIIGDLNVSNTTFMLITNTFVRPIPLAGLLIYKFFGKRNKNIIIEFILFAMVIFSNSPTGMPRFQAAATYIPILLIYFKILRQQLNFAVLFLLAFLIIFPFLDQFRSSIKLKKELSLNTEMFVQGHFDSYQNTINVIKDETITYGNQLLGVCFFYIPRSLWIDKPIGSGSFIANKNNYDWANIALSFFGEGFINFGFFGIFIFTLFLAVFNAKMDYMFWNEKFKRNYFKLLYFYLLGLMFFIMRGDLLSSFSFTIGILLSVVVVYKISISKK